MSDSLRNRLIASDGFGDALSALRADRAIAVVAEWLRAEASNLADAYAGSAFPGDGVGLINLLEGLADSLTKTTGGTDGA